MKRFDGMYGKLVKDWRLDEWAQFYHDHCASSYEKEYLESMLHYLNYGNTSEEQRIKGIPFVERLFCGPYFSDAEISKYVDCTTNTFIDTFDVPLSHLRECNSISWKLSREEQADQLKSYEENYPWPPVAKHFIKRLRELNAKEIERTFNSPIWEVIEGMTEEAANSQLSHYVQWNEFEGYGGHVERETNAREYAYLVAKYPNLRDETFDRCWTEREGYIRFYEQYVEYFANLNDDERARLNRCRKRFEVQRLGRDMTPLLERFGFDRTPRNINPCDTLDGCWWENAYQSGALDFDMYCKYLQAVDGGEGACPL